MAGDYTRFRYSPLKDTNGVLTQQGRVMLDQDWNEYVQLQDRRWRSESMDIMGRAVVPIDTITAFEIIPVGPSFTIGIGRMYVDGLQPENHGVNPLAPTQRQYDPILGEFIGNAPIPYEKQPYLPNPPALPTDNNPHLVYLDVWERELTYLEDPGLIDQAVAVDTGTRLQTVWQVKVLGDSSNINCSTPPFDVFPPSAGRLTTAAAGVPASTDPCIVPANGGYRGSGNRCYRVEIHNGGALGTAQFKWSRDNASVATAVTGINAALDTLTVVLTKRDSVLRFQPGDWVEVTDDVRYFAGQTGEMRQVSAVDDVNLTIQLKTTLPAGQFDATDPKRHTRVIRWDQKGIVRDTLGNQIVDVDANGGLIPVPLAGTTIVLEDGIQITFSVDSAIPIPVFHALDYWMFAARVVDASVEILTQEPPRGILHHYAWLAFVTFPGKVTNCRVFWPPSGGESCDCTVCVSAESHNTNTLTINSAISQVAGTGGKICLGPGTYFITTPVTINGPNNIEISGHGFPSLKAVGLKPQQPIMQIAGSGNISIEDVGFIGPDAGENQTPVAGALISNSAFVRFNRCLFATGAPSVTGAGGGQSTMSLGVGLSGFIWDLQIHDCLFNTVRVGIGPASAEAELAPFVAFSSFRDNEMICIEAGLRFADPKLVAQFLEVSFADNLVSGPIGVQFGGQGLGIVVERNSFNVTAGTPTDDANAVNAAIVCAGSQTRISNNEIGGDAKDPGRDGIILNGRSMYGTQVTGNHIDNLTLGGIRVKRRASLLESVIAHNQLLNIGGPGIQMERSAFAIDLDITNNSLAFVGLTSAPDPSTKAAAIMGGIVILGTVANLNVNENVIEIVGPDPTTNVSRFGIALLIGVDIRIAGNRVLDIGPQAQLDFSAGILVIEVVGRLDIVDNEVRRASVPSLKGDTAGWFALAAAVVIGDVSVRGNLMEAFGSAPAVEILIARSCVFSDNQVFLDNPVGNLPALAVVVGVNETLIVAAIIASNNYVQTPVRPVSKPDAVVVLHTKDKTKTLTVLGNITTGIIQANGVEIIAPWLALNAKNV